MEASYCIGLDVNARNQVVRRTTANATNLEWDALHIANAVHVEIITSLEGNAVLRIARVIRDRWEQGRLEEFT